MNYTQTLEFLFQSLPAFETKGATAYKPGLERITAFCRHIGNPQRNFFTIHVAGTNGKGSVSHIIASVLQQAGYRTGLFTSPHLQDFRERIRVDGEMIPKQKVVNFVDKHHGKMVELELSFFEMTAALAFDYFAQSIAGLEQGSVFETVTYERLVTLLQSSGTYALLIGGPADARVQASAASIDAVAKQYGAEKIYAFDPLLDGVGVDVRTSADEAIATVWSNLLASLNADTVAALEAESPLACVHAPGELARWLLENA